MSDIMHPDDEATAKAVAGSLNLQLLHTEGLPLLASYRAIDDDSLKTTFLALIGKLAGKPVEGR